MKFVMCIQDKGCDDLTLHKVYRVAADAADDDSDITRVRIINDSGDDYLYSASRFVPIQLSLAARKSF